MQKSSIASSRVNIYIKESEKVENNTKFTGEMIGSICSPVEGVIMKESVEIKILNLETTLTSKY